ncbi:NADH:flavin oxidoreductase/NADH oxidase [Pseudoroseomonas wenyumeiae]|uniref:NADH:flavin oxidoreductase/NADH oxidase n=1 Tax=Teichococcus wenyumeiae TaxID=2478470 RepID=A0A3A9JFZ0_9PROT|nr:NADH:flavin oxidoreductase/NADH oxidase [Pseudoroseomonas wenyumeiae]RKK02484.1 NADH:flavin oxidoreductase/NADH oxidase [Pseudoroseomonas wenyumeiae]RMI25240.1 NADH:flavin oxidoreductase/NADH oxidase [Pseudoroseomonas wenyumeiae]
MTDLFSPITLRGVTIRNRIGVAPMCQYSCDPRGDAAGKATEWHLAHLHARAIGGAGLVVTEATAVTPEGRITPQDLGLWSDDQIAGHARLAQVIASTGAVPGTQIAHAGRKASTNQPWVGGVAGDDAHGWEPLAPSAVAFPGLREPRAMSEAEILSTIEAFAATARRAVKAGYRFIELHAAHGYLLHQFLSPLSNQRNDAWGGDFAGRSRIVLEAVKAVRAVMPDDMPLGIRFSHTDWLDGGWTTEETVELSRQVKALGVDLVDVSSGALLPAKIPLEPGYQVPGARAVRHGAEVAVAAVGLITEPKHAQEILEAGDADMIFLARALLRDPYWPLHAAEALGRAEAFQAPAQYDRAWGAAGTKGVDFATAAPLPVL